jgi:type I restriction enzyme M protein
MVRSRTTRRPPTTAQRLTSVLKSARDIMRKDKGLNGDLDRLPTLTWLLFLKFLDDMEQVREASGVRDSPLIDPPYRWRDHATGGCRLGGGELLSFVNDSWAMRPDGVPGPGLLAYLRRLAGDQSNPRQGVITSVFSGVVNRLESGDVLRELMDKLNEVRFASSEEIHVLGHVYETLLQEMRDAAGDSGEFYTPRPVIRFMVQVLNPRLGETVLDPACGTGGFLVEALKHLEQQCKQLEDRERLHQGQTILGGEAKPLPYLLALMNLLLHGLAWPRITRGNSLAQPINGLTEQDRVDVILTNPPFGGEEERAILRHFPQDKQTTETALLFLQLIMARLRRSGRPGRAGVVVPNGTLFGEGVGARIREELLREFNVHTIVRLPPGVFAPYAGISTNLLFFDRSGPTPEVWYYEHPLPLGRKTYTRLNPLRWEEFAECLDWWSDRKESDQSRKVSAAEIAANGYCLDIRNPRRAAVRIESPEFLLRQHREAAVAVQHFLRQLLEELGDAFPDPNAPCVKTFFEQAELLVGTPGAVDKVRDLILQLAMRGKLVGQDKSEGTAQDLLARLGGQAVGRDEAPHPLPENWVWARMQDVGEIVGGGTPRTDCPGFFTEEGIPWLTPADLSRLSGKFVSRGRRDITREGLQSCSARLLPKGTVLFSSRAPIGYVAITANELATNQGFKSCIPCLPQMSDFIYYYLRSAAADIDRRATGTTFKEVSGREVKRIMIPLPPLAEQSRITARLDRLFEILNQLAFQLEQARAAAIALTDAALHHLSSRA